MKKMKKRPLATITRELHIVLKRETAGIIEAGKLLLEAQDQLDHGELLPWLAREFRLSKSSAYRYMDAAKFALKFPTVGNLRLAPSALYLLGGRDDDDATFTPEMIVAILAEAKEQWIDEDRCWEIAANLCVQQVIGFAVAVEIAHCPQEPPAG